MKLDEHTEEIKKPKYTPVGKSPYFEIELQNETIWEEEEDEVNNCFVIKVKGTPKPTIKWYKNDMEIIPNEEYGIEENDEGYSILTIRKKSIKDIQEITCKAINDHGIATTKTLITTGIVPIV